MSIRDLSGNGLFPIADKGSVEEHSATDGFSVTPSDTTVFDKPTRGIYIGGAGNIAVRMVSGTVLTFTSVPAGSILPVQVDQVRAANTTASAIIGLF